MVDWKNITVGILAFVLVVCAGVFARPLLWKLNLDVKDAPNTFGLQEAFNVAEEADFTPAAKVAEDVAQATKELDISPSLNASTDIDIDDDDCGPITKAEAQYTYDAIKSAPLIRSPYPHIYLTPVYHPRVFKCVLKHMPVGNSTAFVRTQKKPRFSIRLTSSVSDKSGLNNVAFWRSFSKELGGSRIAMLWVERFRSVLKERGNLKKPSDVLYNLDLSRDTSGWFIKPHTDSVAKLVTTLYYLPPDTSNSDIGTAIFNGGKQGKDLKMVKTAPFVPNAVLAFAPCTRSWHGVSETALDKVAKRDTIQAFVRPRTPVKSKGEC
ncbi:hypothetical protein CYMTET_47598 [Cymbomonas tetramitiformis]|uniref:Uncharacterized protein n=1 Tax=Cymbomonas tetramitiformis TaxID=36881 RepID=A0AAE0EWJ3_9CHLO|nr:hypothetical protein CYMTET_47598 [Cymbomonas tetramitiformis]